jgi:hypothetical protein
MSAVVEMTPEPKPRRSVAISVAPTPLDIVQGALKSGNVEMYREAVALFKELEGMAARKAFDNAVADAKAEIPVIRKNRAVDFTTSKGRTNYRFEDLAEIARTVDPILGKFGLSYRFRVTSNVNEPVTVTCILSQREGHFEETTLSAGRDDSGNKNAIQGIGSTVTYLQRYTLKAALGLAVAHDDDGRTSEQSAEPETYTPPAGSITQDQVDFIRDALAEKGASVAAFLQWAGKKRIEDIPAGKYAASVNAIANYKPAK